MKRFSLSLLCGTLIIILGLFVIAGWLLKIQALTSILPEYISMVFNTAISFLLSGIVLIALNKRNPIAQRLIVALGLIIFFIAALSICQIILGRSLGIDEFFIKANFNDINPFPGRMAVNTAICFILASISMMALAYGKNQNKFVAIIIQLTIFIIFFLGISALLGYLFNINFLYNWYRYSQMAVHTAAGMILLSIGLASAWNQHEYYQQFYQEREDKRIIVFSMLIFLMATYITGICGFAFITKDTEKLLSNYLNLSLHNRITIFQNAIDDALQNIQVIETSAKKILLSNSPEDRGFNDILLLYNNQLTAISIQDINEQPVYELGHFIKVPVVEVPINLPNGTKLFWKNGWFLKYKSILSYQHKKLGYLSLQWPLKDVNFLFNNSQGRGQTGESVICAPQGQNGALCLPSRLSSKPFNLKFTDSIKSPGFPMYNALQGRQGVVQSLDYRNQSVIAAYGPINQIGLGLVNKIDTSELYKLILKQFYYVLLVICFVIIACCLFIHYLIRPLLKRIVNSEKAVREQKNLLETSESRLHAIMDNSSEGFITINEAGKIISFNKKAEVIFGYSSGEIIGQDIKILVPSRFHDAHEQGMRRFLEIGVANIIGKQHIELIGLRKSGEEFPLELSLAEIFHNDYRLFTGILRDITQRKAVEASLIESEHRFSAAFANAAIGMALVSLEGHWLKVNHALCGITGYTETELLQTTFQALTYKEDLETDLAYIKQLLEGTIKSYQLEKRYYHKQGHTIWILLSVSLVRDKSDNPLYFISQIQDITKQKQSEQQLIYQAYHDPLTGLANRIGLEFSLSSILASAKRNNKMLAILFIDLDHFKQVNDQFGHDAGDILIKHVAECLKQCTRSSDIAARLGGDEFVVVLTDIEKIENVAIPAEKIINYLAMPVKVKSHELYLTTSIGISLYPNDGQDIPSLLKSADVALYQAKDFGRNNYQFCSSEYTEKALRKLDFEKRLHHALTQGEIHLCYQPIIDTLTNDLVSMEALLRWSNKKYGDVLPEEILPIADETGLILPIGQWIFEEVCKQAQEWQNNHFQTRLAINISIREFKSQDFIEKIKQVLNKKNIPPACLELEVSENLIMHDPEKSNLILRQIQQMGIRITIDDFGIGYSSIMHLRNFHINQIKISRNLIKNIVDSSADLEIVSAIIAMAKKLKINVVAVGVETKEQRDLLIQNDCILMQGYYFSYPVSAENAYKFSLKNSA